MGNFFVRCLCGYGLYNDVFPKMSPAPRAFHSWFAIGDFDRLLAFGFHNLIMPAGKRGQQ